MIIAYIMVAIVIFEVGFYFGIKAGKRAILGPEVRIPWEDNE